jgi:hypothetical protein
LLEISIMSKTLMIVLLSSVPVCIAGQATPAKSNAPEVFSGTAAVKNAAGGVTATLEVRVNRYTPDFERKRVEDALKFGGYPKFLSTLRATSEAGQVVLGGGEPYAIRYARETVGTDGRVLVLVTDKPVFFVGGGRSNAKPKEGYELAVLELRIDGAGAGRGTMAGAARVRPDGDGGVILDQYAEQPIEVTKITRKPL